MIAMLKRNRHSARAAWVAIIMTATPVSAHAGEFEIDWWTIDSGGTIENAQGEWTLAGTLGQWDVPDQGAAGGSWFLEGGFWAFNAPVRGDRLFIDRFESSGADSMPEPATGSGR